MIKKITDSDSALEDWFSFRNLVGTILAAACIFAGYGWLMHRFFENPGAVGDAFGALNAFVAFLAFAGLVITLTLQRRDLHLQKQSLDEQIAESRKSAQALENQVRITALSAQLNSLPELIADKNRVIGTIYSHFQLKFTDKSSRIGRQLKNDFPVNVTSRQVREFNTLFTELAKTHTGLEHDLAKEASENLVALKKLRTELSLLYQQIKLLTQ